MIDIGSTIRIAIAMEQMQPPITFADAGILYAAEQAITAHGLGAAVGAMDKAGTLDQTIAAAATVLNDAKKMLADKNQRAQLLAVMGSL